MLFKIANRWNTCSTLIMSSLGWGNKESFIKSLKKEIEAFSKGEREERFLNGHILEEKRKTNDGYDFDQYAFVIGTMRVSPTLQPSKRFMEEVGFKFTEPQYNGKNKSEVWLFYSTPQEILEKLKEYDDEGNLINQKIDEIQPLEAA